MINTVERIIELHYFYDSENTKDFLPASLALAIADLHCGFEAERKIFIIHIFDGKTLSCFDDKSGK